MILLIGSRKGGVGKSTLVVNLSAELLKRRKNIILVDADKQSTSLNWVEDRNNSKYKLKKINFAQHYGDIKNKLDELSKKYDVVIVDVAGYDSIELRTALSIADIFIVPTRPSQVDLDTLPHLSNLLNATKSKAKAYCLLNMCPTNVFNTEQREAKEIFQDIKNIQLLKSILHDRKIYRDVMPLGVGVTEVKNNKARAEIELLLDEVVG